MKVSRSSVEKRIGEMSPQDEIVRVHARVFRTNPFIIEDETGKAAVKADCALGEGDRVRVIGYVSIKGTGALPEIDPIAVQDMSRFDYDLYEQARHIKERLTTNQWHGK